MLRLYMALCVRMYVCQKKLGHFLTRSDAEIWYVDCSHKYKINQGVMERGWRPSVEDNLRWKTTFGGRRPSVEDDLCWILALPTPLCGIFYLSFVYCMIEDFQPFHSNSLPFLPLLSKRYFKDAFSTFSFKNFAKSLFLIDFISSSVICAKLSLA